MAAGAGIGLGQARQVERTLEIRAGLAMLDQRMIHQRNSLRGPAALDDVDGLQNIRAGNVVGAALFGGDRKSLFGRGDRSLQVACVKKETRRGEQRRHQSKRMNAASRVANGGFYRLRRQFQLAKIKVGKAEPNQPKRSDVSARNECHRTGGFLVKVRQSPFEVKFCVFEFADVQTGGTELVVT